MHKDKDVAEVGNDWEDVDVDDQDNDDDNEWEDGDSHESDDSGADATKVKLDINLSNGGDKSGDKMKRYMEVVNGQVIGKNINENKNMNNVKVKSYGFYLDFWKKNKVTEMGELQLEDGRTIGHKDFKLVYKQKPVFLNMLKFNTYMDYMKNAELNGESNSVQN